MMAIKKPIEASLIGRALTGLKYIITGQTPELFSPLAPMQPITTPAEQELIAGRAWDFPVGINTVMTPRSTEGINFSHLRALADGYDLMRLAIETRKDQVSKLKWTAKPKDPKAKPDARCKEIDEFFISPDKEHDWNDWLRMLVEDMLVIDAPVVFPRYTNGGQLYSFELIDGSTITRKIDMGGRTPMPPQPAFQQIIKGVPIVNFTRDEILYKPRNVRNHKSYGYSPVEQVITTVNIALRRQIHQLQYYTEGSTPDLIMSVPVTWNPNQTKEFSEWWNSTLQGNTGGRRGTMFVPDGAKPIDTKDKALKDDFDEWLARIICYAFSLNPQALLKQVNRATAMTAKEEAQEEGVEPLLIWIKSVVDTLIVRYFGYTDIELSWLEETETSPLVNAQVNQIYIGAKVLTPDEVRAELGLDPLTPEERDAAFPQPIMGQVDENGEPVAQNKKGAEGETSADKDKPADKKPEDKADDDAEKVAKAGLKPINRDRKSINKLRLDLAAQVKKLFKAERAKVAAQVTNMIGKGGDDTRIDEILAAIDLSGFDVIVGDSEETLAKIAKDGAIAALTQLGIDDADMLEQANEAAIKWAHNHAAELVGKKWVKGELVDNPNVAWQISESTREMLRGQITEMLEAGWSNDKMAGAIESAYAFSDERALAISRTETSLADIQGNMSVYRESGEVVAKRWLLSQGEFCDECDEIAQGGDIPIDEDFAGGYDSPPAHPNCRCDVIPILSDEDEGE